MLKVLINERQTGKMMMIENNNKNSINNDNDIDDVEEVFRKSILFSLLKKLMLKIYLNLKF